MNQCNTYVELTQAATRLIPPRLSWVRRVFCLCIPLHKATLIRQSPLLTGLGTDGARQTGGGLALGRPRLQLQLPHAVVCAGVRTLVSPAQGGPFIRVNAWAFTRIWRIFYVFSLTRSQYVLGIMSSGVLSSVYGWLHDAWVTTIVQPNALPGSPCRRAPAQVGFVGQTIPVWTQRKGNCATR